MCIRQPARSRNAPVSRVTPALHTVEWTWVTRGALAARSRRILWLCASCQRAPAISPAAPTTQRAHWEKGRQTADLSCCLSLSERSSFPWAEPDVGHRAFLLKIVPFRPSLSLRTVACPECKGLSCGYGDVVTTSAISESGASGSSPLKRGAPSVRVHQSGIRWSPVSRSVSRKSMAAFSRKGGR